jgi:hypothetical protein
MKIQEMPHSHFSSAYTDNIYQKKSNDEYIINSPCVYSDSKIIRIGKIYLLSGFKLPGRSSILALMQVLAIYQFDGINLVVVDIRTLIKYNLNFGLSTVEGDCSAQIIDIEYFNRNFRKWKNDS